MGKRYVEHSDMCGCERCALEWEREDGPRKVFDVVEDPDYDEEGRHYSDSDFGDWRSDDP